MALELNSTNITTILVNLSCCINDLAKQQLYYASVGNKKCLKEVRNKSIILDEIYNILYQNFDTDYPTDCFTTDELEDLYQKALNICRLCNCNK